MSIYFLPVTVEFDTTGYVVAEGGSVDVVLMVTGGTLGRDVMVQLTVAGGTAEGKNHLYVLRG